MEMLFYINDHNYLNLNSNLWEIYAFSYQSVAYHVGKFYTFIFHYYGTLN